MKILVMDDDYRVWKSGIDFLKLFEHHDVMYCRTTDEAVTEFETEAFDLVFLDVNIAPGEYFSSKTHNEDRYVGLLVARHFRDVESKLSRSPAKMFFYTNWDDNTLISITALELNMKYLEKPIDLNILGGICNGSI